MCNSSSKGFHLQDKIKNVRVSIIYRSLYKYFKTIFAAKLSFTVTQVYIAINPLMPSVVNT
jgi:hypothetical protein